MVLVKYFDYYKIGFGDRRKHDPSLKDLYITHELDDVFKVADHTNNCIAFERRYKHFPELQFYRISVQDIVMLMLQKGKYPRVRKQNDAWEYNVAIPDAVFEQLRDYGAIPSGGNFEEVSTLSFPIFAVTSMLRLPILTRIGCNLPPPGKKEKITFQSLEGILGGLNFPAPEPAKA